MRYVNYFDDILKEHGNLLFAEYEKANIWPIGEADAGVSILWEELEESCHAVDALIEYGKIADIDHHFIPSKKELGDLKAFALEAICELLQVVAVCNKYGEVFAKALEEVGADNE